MKKYFLTNNTIFAIFCILFSKSNVLSFVKQNVPHSDLLVLFVYLFIENKILYLVQIFA